MIFIVLLGLAAIGAVVFVLLKKQEGKAQVAIAIDEQKKSVDQTQLDVLKSAEPELKAAAKASQANATEEQKKEFWNEEFSPKPDSNK